MQQNRKRAPGGAGVLPVVVLAGLSALMLGWFTAQLGPSSGPLAGQAIPVTLSPPPPIQVSTLSAAQMTGSGAGGG